MEQPKKDKRQTGQSVAFYTALAVCLIAVGVGTWQLLRTGDGGQAVSAVSSPVTLPEPEPVPEDVTAPDPEAVSEPDDVSALKPNNAASGESKPTSDAGQTDGKTSSDASKADGKASGDANKSNGKTSTDTNKSNGKTSSDTNKSSGKTSSDTNKSSGKTSSDANKSNGKTSGDANKSNGKTSSDANKSSGKTSSDANKSSGKTSGDTVRPVEGNIVTGFSMDKLLYNETMRDWRTHDGIDIAADAGTAVAAAKAGTVESVTADPIMGTTVVIRHEGKWESVYSSLTDAPEVEAGDEVTAGQVIGYVGQTAASESALGPHLHFTVLNDGAPSDPEAFLS